MTEQKQYQCRHIFTDGHRCGSRCLRGEALCYYHHTTRKPAANPRTRRSRTSTFELPLPEDHSAIQHSIGQVLQRIASNQIDPRRAGLLLYGLQIASLNLPKPKSETKQETVEELTTHPKLGTLAPPSELNASKPKSAVQKLIEDLMNEPEIEPRHKQPTPHPEHTILPNLNASVEEPPIPVPKQKSLPKSEYPRPLVSYLTIPRLVVLNLKSQKSMKGIQRRFVICRDHHLCSSRRLHHVPVQGFLEPVHLGGTRNILSCVYQHGIGEIALREHRGDVPEVHANLIPGSQRLSCRSPGRRSTPPSNVRTK